jgi:hypothetical protein|tara:strand:+ start:109994 stop:110143 length:150 start_codon:yes stop_codon:yes gene_type:complete
MGKSSISVSKKYKKGVSRFSGNILLISITITNAEVFKPAFRVVRVELQY